LEQARDDALKVLNEAHPRDISMAYLALGHAFEDLAFLCGENSYDQALDAYHKAILESHSLDPVPYVSRGRTYFKRFSAGRGRPLDLESAERDLKASCQLLQSTKKADVEAEARLWLAQTYLEMNKDREAEDHITRGISGAEGGWLAYAVFVVGKEYQKAAASGDREQSLRMLKASRKHYEMLREKKAASRSILIGMLAQTWLTEGKIYDRERNQAEAGARYNEVRKAYDSALGQNPQPNVEAVQLLLWRTDLVLGNDQMKKADLARERPQSITDALTAARLAKEANLPRGWEAGARYRAGLVYYEKGLSADRDAQEEMFRNALKSLREALRLDPSSAAICQWRNSAGMACLRVKLMIADKSPEEARRLVQEAIRYFTEVIRDPKATDAQRTYAENVLSSLRQN
jgi:tetratricopeptide (TPR) repeat protein